MTDNNERPIEDELLQEEAQERLSLDTLPDFVDGVVSVNGVDTQAKLYRSLFIYCNKSSSTHPLMQSYCIGHLATGKTLIVHGDFSTGLNQQQAKRIASWISPLEWSVDTNGKLFPGTDDAIDSLITAYAERDWVLVEKLVGEIDSRRLVEKIPEKSPPTVDTAKNAEYTSTVNNAEPKPQTINLKGVQMSATAEMPNGVSNEVSGEGVAEIPQTAPKKRGRRKRDPNSKAAVTRPGILMKPVAGFSAKAADNLAQEFGEKASLVYAAGVLVLSQIPIEQQAEAFKQAKIAHVGFVRDERAKQGTTGVEG